LERTIALIKQFLRLAGWLALLAILLLSVVPGDLRPHMMPSKQMEHFTAYLIAALMLALVNPVWWRTIVIALSLMLYSGILETVQLWIPGRTSSVADFAASSLGAWCAVFLVPLICRAPFWSGRRVS
jgi:VanZ like family.